MFFLLVLVLVLIMALRFRWELRRYLSTISLPLRSFLATSIFISRDGAGLSCTSMSMCRPSGDGVVVTGDVGVSRDVFALALVLASDATADAGPIPPHGKSSCAAFLNSFGFLSSSDPGGTFPFPVTFPVPFPLSF